MSCSRGEHTTEYLKPSQLFWETMKGTYYMPSAACTLHCVPVSPHIYHRTIKCRTFFSQPQIEYMKPSQLFRETMKRGYWNSVFLGFSFSNAYAIVTISQYPDTWARVHREFPIDTTLLENLVDAVGSIINDPDENYELVGIVVEETNSEETYSAEDIHDLMYILCKKGNFESLKYTRWKNNLESENSAWDRSAFASLFWSSTSYIEHERLEVLSAENVLASFLDFFYALYADHLYVDKDEKREDKDLEREDSKRKIGYLKPLQLFRETMKKEYRNRVVIGFSFSKEYTIVTISNYPISRARIYGEFPIDTALSENLVDAVQSIINDPKDIHNLMDNLCKRVNFKSLKYTCWKDCIGSKNSIYDSSFFSAELMLQRFQDVLRALCIDKDEEDKD